jgi:nucleoside-diphosphate-sugar epimerase
MRVLLTGATGFIGSHLVPELINAGHRVVGLSRSAAGADALTHAGAEVLRGDVNDFARLRAGAKTADAVIHAAFNHDFSNLKENSENDRKVIEMLGESLAGSDRPLLITSGTGLVRSETSGLAAETDPHVTSTEFPRAASEEAADVLIDKGMHVMVIRLPQVHDTRKQGRITHHIQLARQHGWVAYVGEGKNRLPAVHISDAVRLYRLALEKGSAGARYHGVDEEGVPMRDIAQVIGAGLNLPVESLTPEQAPAYFGSFANLAMIDLAASGAMTREQLSWNPSGSGLLADLRNMDYSVVLSLRRSPFLHSPTRFSCRLYWRFSSLIPADPKPKRAGHVTTATLDLRGPGQNRLRPKARLFLSLERRKSRFCGIIEPSEA